MGALSHLRIVALGAAATSYAPAVCRFRRRRPKSNRRRGPAAPRRPLRRRQQRWFAFLNFTKSSMALDPDDPKAVSRLTELIGGCDILLDGATSMQRLSESISPTQAVIGSSPRGELVRRRGPYAKFEATDSRFARWSASSNWSVREERENAPDFQTGILPAAWGFIADRVVGAGRMQDGPAAAAA